MKVITQTKTRIVEFLAPHFDPKKGEFDFENDDMNRIAQAFVKQSSDQPVPFQVPEVVAAQ